MEVIQTRENNTVKAGITQSHKMTIDEGASIFYLLSEALYSDPVISSVREIITNAYDAHIVNGVKEPVKVTTSGETGLITVQDSGGGIPHYEFNNNFNLWKQSIDELVEPLSTYTEPLEAKIRRQATEITRLLAENEKLKAENGNVIWEIEQAFDRGCNAAWELARKIVLKNGYSAYDLHEIFNCCGSHQALEDYTYPEAAAKVAEWEKAKEEIKVGDIVRCKSETSVEFCVTEISCHGRLYGIGRNGGTYSNKNPKDWEKTGRHIDIDSFLKQIGGEQEC